jgi:hypothetical protein
MPAGVSRSDAFKRRFEAVFNENDAPYWRILAEKALLPNATAH